MAAASGQAPPVSNAGIAGIFEEIAGLLELEDANPWRIRAYRNAARTLQAYGPAIAELLAGGGELPKLPGIGEDLSAKIHEIVDTGTCELRERLHREVPAGLLELTAVAGLGPKRTRRLYHDLGIETLQQLRDAARSGRIKSLHGFGDKTQARLLQSVEERLQSERRWPIAIAAEVAETLAAHLRAVPGVSAVTIAGSFRRMRDTVGDIDLLVATSRPAEAIRQFVAAPAVAEVLAQGAKRATVVLREGLQVDLRVVRQSEYGAALVYFTGSKAHNIAIRRLAQDKGLKINEYGVFRGAARVAGATEASVYQALGLAPVEPELRENRGEVEAARQGGLPHLVGYDDLRGDLHCHTRATDGSHTLAEMAEAAQGIGLDYLAITDHSRHLRMAHGLDATALRRQCDAIDALNARLKGITLLKGVEVDILEDGKLDLADEVLAQLDIVVAAVHSHFDLAPAKQTTRILRALEHPRVGILAHPFARLIDQRPPIGFDWPKVMRAAAQAGCAFELNCQPQRMDLFDLQCRQARDEGVRISINSDAHRTSDFGYLRFGVGQARRGWLEKRDVLNALPLTALRQWLQRR